jgi:hypothetical protein
MIFSSNNPVAAATGKWYQRALVYVGFTVVIIAIFIALIAIGSESGLSLQQRLWQGIGVLVACSLVAGGYLTLVRAEAATNGNPASDGVVPATIVFDAVCFTVGGLVIVSFANPANPRQWAATIMWALACLAIGAIGGFLFGIPRSRRESRLSVGISKPPNSVTVNPTPPNPTPPNTAPANPQSPDNAGKPDPAVVAGATAPPDVAVPSPAVPPAGDLPIPVPPSTGDSGGDQPAGDPSIQDNAAGGDPSPIEQISDWLTKIIVGLGLANVKELPGQLDRWAQYVAISIGAQPEGSGASLALGMILYFLILGFMACYILTQIFLRNLINKTQ